MKQLIILFSLLVFIPQANAQYSSHKKKNSTSAGTFFFYWGYNRSSYTDSRIHFKGTDYDFTLGSVTAHDRPDKFDPSIYLNLKRVTIPQYNARIGYYYTDKWAISFGVDHMKYVMDDHNDVILNGYIKPGIDSTWSGTYGKLPVTTSRDHFHYENTNGLNFLRFELTRSIDIAEFGSKRLLAFTGNIGGSTGPMLTFNDLKFAERHTIATPSLSGYGFSLNTGLRIEFFKRIFLQANAATGFVHLTHVRTRPDNRNDYAQQVLGYFEYNLTIGSLFYFRSKNGCDSCPNW